MKIPRSLFLLTAAALVAGNGLQYSEEFEEALVCETKGVQAEIIMVVDRSFSIGGYFKNVKEFLKTLVSQLEISQSVTRIAVVSYADTTTVDFDLRRYNDGAAILRHVETLSNRLNGGLTRTMDGLKAAREKVYPQRRPGVPVYVILLTDGESNDGTGSGGSATQKTIGEASLLRSLDQVTVIAVGMGPTINRNELVGVATKGEQNVFTVSTFDKLDKTLVDSLLSKTCVKPDNPCEYYKQYGDVIFVPASQHLNPLNGQLTLKIAEAFSKSTIVGSGDYVRVGVAPMQCQLGIGYSLMTSRGAIPSITSSTIRSSFLHTADYLKEVNSMFVPRSDNSVVQTKVVVIIIDHRLPTKHFQQAKAAADQLKGNGVLVYTIAVGGEVDRAQVNALASSSHSFAADDYTGLFSMSESVGVELNGNKFSQLFELLHKKLCYPKKQ